MLLERQVDVMEVKEGRKSISGRENTGEGTGL